MKKFLLLLTALLATTGVAQDHTIISPKPGQSIKFKVNDGGAVKDAMVVDSTGVVDFPFGTTGAVPDASVSVSGVVNTSTQTFAGNKIIQNASGVTLALSKPSGAALSLWPDALGTANVYHLDNSAGSLRFYNHTGQVSGSIAQNSKWVLGSPGYAGSHTINGGIRQAHQVASQACVGAGCLADFPGLVVVQGSTFIVACSARTNVANEAVSMGFCVKAGTSVGTCACGPFTGQALGGASITNISCTNNGADTIIRLSFTDSSGLTSDTQACQLLNTSNIFIP